MKRDFCSPVQGGWEQLNGVFVPVSEVVSTFQLPQSHPDLIDAEDESDVEGYLDDMLMDRPVPSPERVVLLAPDHTRGASGALQGATGYYAYWSKAAWQSSADLIQALNGRAIGPVSIKYKYPRVIPLA